MFEAIDAELLANRKEKGSKPASSWKTNDQPRANGSFPLTPIFD
jgi:hypothetical protein